MASVNKVILVGNLGADPETRYLANGDAVTNFSLATTDRWKDKDGGQQERTEWHRVVCWRRLGEIAREYLRKGSAVYIEGRIQTQKYEKDGETKYSTQIVADSLQMLGSKPDGERSSKPKQEQRSKPNQRQQSAGGFDGEDDDIPF